MVGFGTYFAGKTNGFVSLDVGCGRMREVMDDFSVYGQINR